MEYAGVGGIAHYVKMVQGGIKQGMLGVLRDVWETLFKCLGLGLGETTKVFSKRAKERELVR